MNIYTTTICAAMLIFGGCATRTVGDGGEAFYLVDGVLKVDKRFDLPSNLEPWLEAEQVDKDMDEVIVVAHGCNFYDIEYSLYDATEERDTVKVRVQPGEFCNLKDVVFAHPTIIRVRRWNGVKYFIDEAPLVFAEDDIAYIPGVYLPEDWGVDRLLIDYPPSQVSPFCMNVNQFSSIEANWLRSSPAVSVLGDELCHSRVLPLRMLMGISFGVNDGEANHIESGVVETNPDS